MVSSVILIVHKTPVWPAFIERLHLLNVLATGRALEEVNGKQASRRGGIVVNSYPRLEAGGLLHLYSTAILQTLMGQQLWLHRPMHQGTVTRCPS